MKSVTIIVEESIIYTLETEIEEGLTQKEEGKELLRLAKVHSEISGASIKIEVLKDE